MSGPPSATSRAPLAAERGASDGAVRGAPLVSHGSPLDPRARTLWAVYGAGIGVLVAVVAVIGVAFVANPWPLAVLLIPGLAAVGAWYARLHWERWHWAIRTEALELRHGVVVHNASSVPYHRIQQIDVERGPADRAFGLARLVVHTASATTDASVPGLDADDARSLRRHLLERASIEDVSEDDGV